MEKKLRPFNLEAAKNGKLVINRVGNPVRIICWDRLGNRQLVTLHSGGAEERTWNNFNNGCVFSDMESNYDLFMAPDKKTVWVNIYSFNERITSNAPVYETEKEAIDGKSSGGYIGTYPITIEI